MWPPFPYVSCVAISEYLSCLSYPPFHLLSFSFFLQFPALVFLFLLVFSPAHLFSPRPSRSPPPFSLFFSYSLAFSTYHYSSFIWPFSNSLISSYPVPSSFHVPLSYLVLSCTSSFFRLIRWLLALFYLSYSALFSFSFPSSCTSLPLSSPIALRPCFFFHCFLFLGDFALFLLLLPFTRWLPFLLIHFQ